MTANSNCSTHGGTFWIWIDLRFYSDHKHFVALIIRCTKYFECLIFGHYCVSEILLTSKFSQTTVLYKIFEISNECLFLRGAYFHGVLINTCNFFVVCSCVGMVYFRPRGYFSTNFSPMFSTTRDTVSNRSIVANPRPPT